MRATQGIDKALCDKLGPNFLDLFAKYNSCSKESIPSNAFKSYDIFCEWYRNDPQAKDCVTTAVAQINVNVPGIIAGDGRVGECCNSFPVCIFCFIKIA